MYERPGYARLMDTAAPRLAATLLVLRDAPLRVLMVRRHASATFPSALVFPGGVVEPADGAERGRALRTAALRETWEECGIRVAGWPDEPRLHELHPFGHWVTPESQPKRFDTMFFAARMPEGQEAGFDGLETVSAEWVEPGHADAALLFPTVMSLRLLGASSTVAEALAAADARPLVRVQPEVEVVEGRVRLSIPAAAGYGLTEYFPE